jgi:inorganic pyrophosphatase
VQTCLKIQLFLSTALMVGGLYLASYLTLPDRLFGFAGVDRSPLSAWACSLAGLISGCVIGFITEFYTSHAYAPVREVSNACSTGAATNIIYGLALGHLSTIIPIICLALTAFVAYTQLSMFGVALSALGMLSTLTVGLAIDAYGPVSDNAGGFAEMCGYPPEVRERTDQLDAAGNCTAAIGKGFAIGSAALVSLSLYGAYVTRASNPINKHPLGNLGVNVPLVFFGLLIGAMIPYWFSALTMKSVGKAALEMVQEIRQQLIDEPLIRTGQVKPDYERCIQISTASSLKEMFAPGFLVIFTPLLMGLFFGPTAVAGLLPGILVSGVCMATSSANSGGAWDNAKKYIESGQFEIDGVVKKKGSDEHKAAVIGDTVGDPLKDTSGPSLNILVKLSAIFSLVFAGVYDKTAWLLCPLTTGTTGC